MSAEYACADSFIPIPHPGPVLSTRRSVPVHETPPPNAQPPGFVEHEFELEFDVDANSEQVWAWLESPGTFVGGQVWPFRVEFLSADPRVESGFHVGGINIHHGPGMCLAGLITSIHESESSGREDPYYRELHYFYGSYVGSLRWVRPVSLEFWVRSREDGSSCVRLRVESYVARGLRATWSRAQQVFWRRFPRWMERSLRQISRAPVKMTSRPETSSSARQ